MTCFGATMGERNVWAPRANEEPQDLTRSSCEEHEAVRSVRGTSGGSSSSRSSRISSDDSSSSSTCSSSSICSSSSSSSGESPDAGSAYSSSLPVCPNCQVRHPGGDIKGHFCTEGKQGLLETLVAMGTLGLVSLLCGLRCLLSCGGWLGREDNHGETLGESTTKRGAGRGGSGQNFQPGRDGYPANPSQKCPSS